MSNCMKCDPCSKVQSQNLVILRKKCGYVKERYGGSDDFREPATVVSTRDTPELLQQCPMRHGELLLSVVRVLKGQLKPCILY
jgi:hypothetical protein